jgi:phosphomannomutase
MPSLRSSLAFEPRELAFGTSGRRGLIRDLTDLEISINISAEIEYLKSLAAGHGGVRPGDDVFLARDLRPSSERIGRVIQHALRQLGMHPVNLGEMPTPALTWTAVNRDCASIMVTGSHIPFDRNGYKLNTTQGELLKEQEAPINALVRTVRESIYAQESAASPFAADGSLRISPPALDPPFPGAADAWTRRYTDFVGNSALAGKRILVYQHSAVGRDLLVDILLGLGAEPILVGRSESFVPIDTENIGEQELNEIRRLYRDHGPAWAVVSTDGDSDRPLLLAPYSFSGELRFFSGDLIGMIVASWLHADAVVVPVTCNDAIDRSHLAGALEPKTRIGSPWVIAGMNAALAKGKKVVCGWEANGGFLLGSKVERKGRLLGPLPTRDAFLPLIAVLCESVQRGKPVAELFAELPARYGRSGLLRDFPRAAGINIVENLRPGAGRLFSNNNELFHVLREVFSMRNGFADIVAIDHADGARVHFANGDIVHVRPSGNADELRVYTVSDSPQRADAMVALSLAEPDGILRHLERILR